MDCDSKNNNLEKKVAKFSDITIKLVKPKSYDDLTHSTSSSNSIRRRKTDFDAQFMIWPTTSAQDFVTSYLRMKVRHQRKKHLRTSSKLGDLMLLSSNQSVSGSFNRSSLSMFVEPVNRRSSKEVMTSHSTFLSLLLASTYVFYYGTFFSRKYTAKNKGYIDA